jgi:HSP20 family protein
LSVKCRVFSGGILFEKLHGTLKFKNMTLVRLKNSPGFNNMVNHPFSLFPSVFGEDQNKRKFSQSVPVNVIETEAELILEVVAPGFDKEDFKVNLENDLLTISAERKVEKSEENNKVLRSEYGFRSFKRSFTLPETADAERISAQYVNGVLTLNLPRKEDVKPAVKNITIQ